MTLPFTLPDWLPWWSTFALLVVAGLFGLAFLLMPFSVFGVKGRLDAVEARLDEIQGEIRSLALRLPDPGMREPGIRELGGRYDQEALSRPPIPPAPRPSAPHLVDPRRSDVRPRDAKLGDAKLGDAKLGDARPTGIDLPAPPANRPVIIPRRPDAMRGQNGQRTPRSEPSFDQS